jgi:hypothetical protein
MNAVWHLFDASPVPVRAPLSRFTLAKKYTVFSDLKKTTEQQQHQQQQQKPKMDACKKMLLCHTDDGDSVQIFTRGVGITAHHFAFLRNLHKPSVFRPLLAQTLATKGGDEQARNLALRQQVLDHRSVAHLRLSETLEQPGVLNPAIVSAFAGWYLVATLLLFVVTPSPDHSPSFTPADVLRMFNGTTLSANKQRQCARMMIDGLTAEGSIRHVPDASGGRWFLRLE